MNQDLRSYQFRKEREASWRELEALVEKLERRRTSRFSFEELNRLPHLYRATLSGLSVARAISLDKGIVRYLESLSARAYMALYGSRQTFSQAISRLLGHQVPDAVRRSTSVILLATLFMVLGAVAGYWLVLSDPEQYFAIVPEGLAQGRTPYTDAETLRATIYNDGSGDASSLTAFASALFAHNAIVGIFAFALGFAATAPTILLMFYNGLLLGAMFRVFAMHGLGPDFFAWLSIHGTTELFAIILCGAGGIIIGNAIIFPGRHTRFENLAIAGKRAGLLIVAAIIMLFAAGLIEGIGRQTVQIAELRLLIGFGALALWLTYFMRVGRE